MKTEPNESINPIILRKIGETEFRVASIKDQNQGDYLHSSQGLTKREHFASLAVQGLCAYNEQMTLDDVVEQGVKIADKLIIALNKDL